jgi:hypothetical protein
MKWLLWKDLRSLKNAWVPAACLGLPLLLLIQFVGGPQSEKPISWLAAYWFVFFVGAVSLFYRSFSQEFRSRNLGLYTALAVPRWKVFISQSLIHGLSLLGLAGFYGLIVLLFWSAPAAEVFNCGLWIGLTSMSLVPAGTLLGLLLTHEREFLFSLFFLPLSTPAFLAGSALSMEGSQGWLSVLGILFVLGLFLGLLIFEFFFDEASLND